jgi:ABC-type multidrug transport system fused ATPase/permease subunit
MIPWLTGSIIDNLLSPQALSNLDAPQLVQELLIYGVIGVVVIIGHATVTNIRARAGAALSAFIQHYLRRQLFAHLQRLSLNFFQKHHAGSLGSRVSSDIAHIGAVVDRGIILLIMDGVTLVVLLIIMALSNALLTGVTIATMITLGILVKNMAPVIRRQRKSIQEKQSAVAGRATEYFSAISVVKAYAGENTASHRFDDMSQGVHDLQIKNAKAMGLFHSGSLGIVMITQIAVVCLGAWLIITTQNDPAGAALTTGGLVAFLLYIGSISSSVTRLADSMIMLQDGFAALERVGDLMNLHPDPADKPGAKTPPLRGEIAFRNVSFAYRGPEEAHGDQRVLKDLNVTLNAGKSYAFVGPSGAGKSTTVQLLLRFYDPQSGTILVDGHDLHEFEQETYRQQVAVVLQDPIIFSGSVAENIGFAAEHATPATITAAAKAAHADAFIEELPDQYDTPLGERGVSLSGGQRQRVAIARALIRDPAIMILDEATSALDTVTERQIKDVIDDLQGSRTLIIIAHRLSTIRDVDEILVLDRGELVEQGSYDDLRGRGGLFSQLIAEQEAAEQKQNAS